MKGGLNSEEKQGESRKKHPIIRFFETILDFFGTFGGIG